MERNFDVVVVGGGHAGVEAATAAARRGAQVAIICFSATTIGAMSCNPSIGGVGKGHIVREIDAFDGVMAQAADASAIHHRMLNRSKGRAVQGPRIQADRSLYANAIQAQCRSQSIAVIEGEAIDLSIDKAGKVNGVQLAGGAIVVARAVVLATGTFLGARMFRGDEREVGGRVGEQGASRLGERLRALGLPIGRLKTGTPPRLDGRTIDWARLVTQPSDDSRWTMSSSTSDSWLPQVDCAITATNERTHDIVRAASNRSPLYGGEIVGTGPRYCPSVEDKVRRFSDRGAHQLFLEPEGLDVTDVYPNGLSTSLSCADQARLVSSIAGLEDARIVAWGYAVEYDFLDPRSLDHRLALYAISGVFCAGQINGTTGYEEAAGQGLVAGLNAAAYACDLAPLELSRTSSYLGVMVDDLVLQGVTEPYRMLTARAEYRLSLRPDNAETRLSNEAARLGCLRSDTLERLQKRQVEAEAVRTAFAAEVAVAEVRRRGVTTAEHGGSKAISLWLAHPDASLSTFAPELGALGDGDVALEMAEDARYAPYLARQKEEMDRHYREESLDLPADINFSAIAGLSSEMVERLSASRPQNLGAAGRVSGITPAALTAVFLHAKRLAA